MIRRRKISGPSDATHVARLSETDENSRLAMVEAFTCYSAVAGIVRTARTDLAMELVALAFVVQVDPRDLAGKSFSTEVYPDGDPILVGPRIAEVPRVVLATTMPGAVRAPAPDGAVDRILRAVSLS